MKTGTMTLFLWLFLLFLVLLIVLDVAMLISLVAPGDERRQEIEPVEGVGRQGVHGHPRGKGAAQAAQELGQEGRAAALVENPPAPLLVCRGCLIFAARKDV